MEMDVLMLLGVIGILLVAFLRWFFRSNPRARYRRNFRNELADSSHGGDPLLWHGTWDPGDFHSAHSHGSNQHHALPHHNNTHHDNHHQGDADISSDAGHPGADAAHGLETGGFFDGGGFDGSGSDGGGCDAGGCDGGSSGD